MKSTQPARTPSSRGNLSESKVLTAYIQAGFIVSVPFGGGAPYDLLVDTGSRLLRVQVKTGRLRNGCILFAAQRIHGHHGTKRYKYEAGEFDCFAVYCPDNDRIYVVPSWVIQPKADCKFLKRKMGNSKTCDGHRILLLKLVWKV